MRLLFSLLILVLSFSLLIVQSDSYSSAKVRNRTAISIVSEENALLAVHYHEDRTFTITNHTRKTILIKKVEILNSPDHGIIFSGNSISPSGTKNFSITGEPQGLSGKTIQLSAHWNGGSAKIKSAIPVSFDQEEPDEEELDVDEKQQETEENEVKGASPQPSEKQMIPQTNQNQATTEVKEEQQVIPETLEEKPSSKEEEQRNIEIEQKQRSTDLEDKAEKE